MSNYQSEVVGVVISFASHTPSRDDAPPNRIACLTSRDRIDITRWQDRARQAGYDRMIIHDRDAGDVQDVTNFLSVYRSGEAWSRWGFVRVGSVVRAWCCVTGADIGEFATMSGALEAVLQGTAKRPAAPAQVVALHRADHGSAVITEIGSRRFARQLGSAA
jgi:hypothetical protein